MIVCRKCGFRNADDDAFCGMCGGFLEWTGEKQTPQMSEEVAAEAETAAAGPEPGQPKTGLLQRVVQGANTLIAGPRPEASRAVDGEQGQAPSPGSAPKSVAKKAAPAPPAPAPPPPPPPPPPAPPPPMARPAMPPPPPPPAQPGALPPPPPTARPTMPPPPPPPPAARPDALPPPPPVKAALPPPPPPAAGPGHASALVAPVTRAPAPLPEKRPTHRAEPPVPHREPAEVQEAAPQATRRRALAVTKTEPSRRLKPGDLICGNCGEGNAPLRKFCSRCGDSLNEAEVRKAPWWHRFRRHHGPRTIALGQEAKKSPASLAESSFDARQFFRNLYRKARTVVAVAVILAGVLYGAYPPFRSTVNNAVTSAKNDASNAESAALTPVHPTSAADNGEVPGHPASAAVDESLDTYWLAPWSAGTTPTLTLKFDRPVTLKKLILHSGASDAYIADGRPSSLHLIFSDKESVTLTPQDTSQAQTFDLSHAIQVTSVDIQVTAVYQGSSGSTVAVTEIELFALRT